MHVTDSLIKYQLEYYNGKENETNKIAQSFRPFMHI